LECLRACGHSTNILALYKAICLYLLQQKAQQKPLFSSSNVMPITAMLSKTTSPAPAVAAVATLPIKKMMMHY
jgi:hypothetical protein